jgi:hypothetical protein
VMEKYFLDNDIEEILKAVLDREELTEDFYEKYTELAGTIYLEKELSDYAPTILDFPSLTTSESLRAPDNWTIGSNQLSIVTN